MSNEPKREFAYCGHPLSPPETGYWCRKCGIWIDNTPGEREKYVLDHSPLEDSNASERIR